MMDGLWGLAEAGLEVEGAAEAGGDADEAADVADGAYADARADQAADKGAAADADIVDAGVDGHGYGRAFGDGADDLGLEDHIEEAVGQPPEYAQCHDCLVCHGCRTQQQEAASDADDGIAHEETAV